MTVSDSSQYLKLLLTQVATNTPDDPEPLADRGRPGPGPFVQLSLRLLPAPLVGLEAGPGLGWLHPHALEDHQTPCKALPDRRATASTEPLPRHQGRITILADG